MTIILDIETKHLAAEIGWPALLAGEGGMSVAATVEDETGLVRIWDESTIQELCDYLESADEVVTHNGTAFDLKVIESIAQRSLALRMHTDTKLALSGMSLEKAGLAYVGRGKTGTGTDAPHLYWTQQIGPLVDYCLQDVYLTRDVWRATQRCGIMEEPNDPVADR